jgi:TonB family protein
VLELVIDERGRVVPHSVRVIHRIHPVLDSIAQAVIEHSKFRPTRVRNRSTKTLVQVPITFGSPEHADSGAGIARSNRSDSSIDKVDTHVVNIESLPSKPERVFGPAPRYPVDLLKRRISGVVLVQFILDTTGAPEAGSIKVLRGAHPDFDSEAVYVVRQSRFRPARIADGHAVRVLIQQPITFGVGRER